MFLGKNKNNIRGKNEDGMAKNHKDIFSRVKKIFFTTCSPTWRFTLTALKCDNSVSSIQKEKCRNTNITVNIKLKNIEHIKVEL